MVSLHILGTASMREIEISIHETFQQTVQGEGFWSGTPCDFIRLHGCPVKCPWCDTGYHAGGKGIPVLKLSIGQLLDELKSHHVVISGGEPFIHRNISTLVTQLNRNNKKVHIETSGSFYQPVLNAWITLSPKHHLNSSYPVLDCFWDIANEVKIVISSGSELDFYKHFLSKYSGFVFLQPEWTNKETTIPLTLDLLKENPEYRLSLQTHKLIGVQ